MSGTELLPEVVLRAGRSSARLVDGTVVIERRRATHRIPVAAVERAEVVSGGARLVLTGAQGAEYRLRCRNARAVAAFVASVNRARPVADRAERDRDGVALVESTVRPRRWWVVPIRFLRPLVDAWWKVAAWLYALGFVVLPVLVDLRPTESFALVMLWGFGPPVLAAGVAWVVHGVGRLRAPWLYQFRGVRVMARLDRLREQPYADGDGSYLQGKYAFVDLDGRPRSLERIVSKSARIGDRIELCYVPDQTRLVDTGTRYGAEIAGRSAVLVLFALPTALVGAAMTIGPIVIALSV